MLLRFFMGFDGSSKAAGVEEEGTLAGEMGRDG
jgi:hypothetical protein